MKQYLHETSNEEFQKLIDSGLTSEGCSQQFLPPPWCTYEAVFNLFVHCQPLLGFSGDLIVDIKVRKATDCNNCEHYKGTKVKVIKVTV